MAGPAFPLKQTVPACSDPAPSEADGTELDRGNVEVNDDCCRRFAPRLQVTVNGTARTLFLESDVPTCSKTGTGEKIYSSDSYSLCAGAAGKQWTISFPCPTCPCGGFPPEGVWVGGNVSFNVSGPISGLAASTVDLENQSVFEGLSAQLFRDSLLAMGFTADQFSVTPVWSPTRRYLINFANATAPSSLSLDESTLNDSAAFRTCDASLTGPVSGRVRVDAYLRAAWASCSRAGMVVEVRAVSGDAVIAEYGNDHYAVKHGMRANLARRWALGECSHPCAGLQTPAQIRAQHEPALCVQAVLAQTKCLAGLQDLDVLATFSSDGAGLGTIADGFVGHNQQSTASFLAPGSSSGSVTALGGSVSVDIVGWARRSGGSWVAARLVATFTAGNGQPHCLIRACGWRFNSTTGKFESSTQANGSATQNAPPAAGLSWPAFPGNPQSVNALRFVENAANVYWTITGGSCTLADPVTGLAIPALTITGKTFGAATVNHGTVLLSGRYGWEADALPSICDGVSWLKSDETFALDFFVSGFLYEFRSNVTATGWAPGSWNVTDFLPGSLETSNGTGNSYEAS